MLLSQIEVMVSAALSTEQSPTQEQLRVLVDQVRRLPMFATVTDKEIDNLVKQLETRLDVSMTIGGQLVAEGFKPWLDARRKDIDPFYWGRYRKLLAQQGLPPRVITTLDDVTERITGLLEDPLKEGKWDRRGMVVGHVQSGKTANYTGVICKAADAGYRLIVVVAGIHNNLRSQTQSRIDEGFIGRDTGKGISAKTEDNHIGVGRFDSRRRPATFTSTTRDFNKQQAGTVGVSLDNLKEPAVLVIKKNTSTLGNLIAWLKEHNAKRGRQTIPAPMLLLDDEADNASINTAQGRGEVTRINGQLRELLNMFDRSCYIGYTATPFANIFIDPESEDEMRGDDLFPRDFIISLDPPDNYFGARRVFLDDSEAIIRTIDDNEDLLPLVHRKELDIAGLPGSLIEAVRTFVLARAIRIMRGQGTKHSSMLVNASRFTDVQSALRNEVQDCLQRMQHAARVYGGLPASKADGDPEIRAMRELFVREYCNLGFSWGDVLGKLNEAAAPIRVVEVNSRSSVGLEYADHRETGLNVIAVGGYSLSRGLTLEGLIVSYFLRNSMMYDTLMQMGRWFGYRPGYEDLCRVWMPEEAEGWYAHIAEAIEELRGELKAMEAVKATPLEFGLKVRSHPDTLIVTARNKMGTGKKIVMQIGLGNNFIETAVLRGDQPSMEQNQSVARRFATALKADGHDPASALKVAGGFLLDGVSAGLVIEFIRGFRNSEGSFLTDPGPVVKYVEDRAEDELSQWQVLLAGVEQDDDKLRNDDLLGRTIYCQSRTMGVRSSETAIHVTNRHRVASRGIERTGLDAPTVSGAEQKYLDDNPSIRKQSDEEGKKPNFPDRIYRDVRKRPLLIVHLLSLDVPKLDANGEQKYRKSSVQPAVAWSISFPSTSRPEKKVSYVVGAVWMRENMPDEQDDDLGGDE